MSNLLTRFDAWLTDDGPAALVIREWLQPAEGPDGVVFARASSDANVLRAGASVGYAWTWDAGLTLRLAGGAEYFFASSDDMTIHGVRPIADASLGWTF